MMDLTAPILPGISAAGIPLGGAISEISAAEGAFRISYFASPSAPGTFVTRYRTPEVEIWESNGIITRIILQGSYRGLFDGSIGIGSSIGELEELAGPWSIGDGATITLDDIPGIAFTVNDPFLLATPETAPDALITSITLDLPTRWP